MLSANANATLGDDISAEPEEHGRPHAERAAIQPPGRPPTNVPSGYAAASMPAPVFDRPNCSRQVAAAAA